jgi:transposase
MVAKGRAPKAAHLLGVYGPAHPASHFTHPERERALALFQEGHLRRDIATAIGCSRQIVSHWIYDAFPQSVAMPAGMKRMRKSSE